MKSRAAAAAAGGGRRGGGASSTGVFAAEAAAETEKKSSSAKPEDSNQVVGLIYDFTVCTDLLGFAVATIRSYQESCTGTKYKPAGTALRT